MAFETLPLDAVLASAGLTGATVANLDEDPDSHDTNWAVATDNNVNTEVHASFATPTGALTDGADKQEFRAAVRGFDVGQTGIASARLELWENGVLVRAASDTTINQYDPNAQVISLTWNATEVAVDADVECKVIGTKTGGAPSVRQTIDVGAIEWNAEYTEGGTVHFGTCAPAGTSNVVTAQIVVRPGTCQPIGTSNCTTVGTVVTSGGDLTVTVSASSDDAYQKRDATGYTDIAVTVRVRADTAGSTARDGGCRFTNVTIPQGATINSAILKCYTAVSDDPNLDLHCDNVDNSVTFDSGANDVNGRTKTTASTAWVATNIGLGAYKNSPDMKAAVQEVIDRVGWTSGNALTVILWNKGGVGSEDFQFDSWDASGSNVPTLDINYTSGGTVHFGTCTPDGTSTCTTVGIVGRPGTCAPQGTSNCTTVAILALGGTCVPVGTSSVVTVQIVVRPGTCQPIGTSVCTAVGTVNAVHQGTCRPIGTSNCTSVGILNVFGTASPQGTSVNAFASSLVVAGVASPQGTSNVTTAQIVVRPGTCAPIGTSVCTTIGIMERFGTCVPQGTSNCTTVAILELGGTCTPQGTSNCTTVGTVAGVKLGTCAPQGTSTCTTVSILALGGTCAPQGTSSCTTVGTVSAVITAHTALGAWAVPKMRVTYTAKSPAAGTTHFGTCAPVGTSACTSVGILVLFGDARPISTSVCTTVGVAVYAGVATPQGTSSCTSVPFLTLFGDTVIQEESVVTIAGTIEAAGAVASQGTSNCTTVGTVSAGEFGTCAPEGTSSCTTQGILVLAGTTAIQGTSTCTSNGIVVIPGTCAPQGTSVCTSTGTSGALRLGTCAPDGTSACTTVGTSNLAGATVIQGTSVCDVGSTVTFAGTFGATGASNVELSSEMLFAGVADIQGTSLCTFAGHLLSELMDRDMVWVADVNINQGFTVDVWLTQQLPTDANINQSLSVEVER